MQNKINKYHRRSIRLKEYDYASSGAYYVTIVTKGYKFIFGKVSDQKTYLNNLGKIVHECWLDVPNHFSHVNLGQFIVMPNHLHGILIINDDTCRGTIYRAPTIEKYGQPVLGSIPTIIRTYKAAVSRRSRQELGMIHIWQRNYYEHIIRNQVELNRISRYIQANPENWDIDSEYLDQSLKR